MKIRKTIGLPDHVLAFNPFLPDTGDGASGGTTGGAGAPPVQPPAAPPAALPTPTPPAAPPAMGEPRNGPHGFPENTPLAQMSGDQREAYWKHYARQHEAASKAKDDELEALRPKATQLDALLESTKTDHERAIEAAREEATKAAREAALAEARKTYGTQLVQVRLDAARTAKGLTAEAMAALVIDPARFVGDSGVNEEALTAFLDAIPTATAVTPPRDLGAGRTPAPATSGIAAGAALYEQRKAKPARPA